MSDYRQQQENDEEQYEWLLEMKAKVDARMADILAETKKGLDDGAF